VCVFCFFRRSGYLPFNRKFVTSLPTRAMLLVRYLFCNYLPTFYYPFAVPAPRFPARRFSAAEGPCCCCCCSSRCCCIGCCRSPVRQLLLRLISLSNFHNSRPRPRLSLLLLPLVAFFRLLPELLFWILYIFLGIYSGLVFGSLLNLLDVHCCLSFRILRVSLVSLSNSLLHSSSSLQRLVVLS
jgi:hypothetical protein